MTVQTKITEAQHSLDFGRNYPYDATDAWWNTLQTKVPPPATDWAHAAARGVLADLTNCPGIKIPFSDVDEATRIKTTNSLATIIRLADAQRTLYTVAVQHIPV